MSVPVKRMILYKHGVGFIERGSRFQGDDPVKLSFKRDEMDDILKSLVIFDTGGGRITGVSYETAEDVSELLEDKAINVPERAALVGLMRQLKGYAVEVEVPGRKVTGTVVGTDEENLMTFKGDNARTMSQLVLRDETGLIQSVALDTIESFGILDEEARDDLSFFLDAVTSERKKNVKGVTIFLDGKDHDLNVSYITSMPSWRVSYRLVFDEEKTMLQGWGIVDNRMDEDLRDVRLSLVAGKPISFVYDIYTPRTVKRPVVREEFRGVAAPVELESEMEELARKEPRMMMVEEVEDEGIFFDEEEMEYEISPERIAIEELSLEADYEVSGPRRAAAGAPPRRAMAESTKVDAKAVEMGEFFKYDIETPITIKRGQSAMVPILQCDIGCKKEHVYNSDKMARHPVVSMRLTNDTGAILERGPVVVLDEGTYVGEAMLPYTTLDGETHVAYSVDLGVIVNERSSQDSELCKVTIGRRVEEDLPEGDPDREVCYLRKMFLESRTTTYEVQNKKTEPVDLVIEKGKTDWGELDEEKTPKPAEETENYLRWVLKLEPKTSTEFDVRLVKDRYETEEVVNVGMRVLDSLLSNKKITKKDHKKLAELVELYERLEELETDRRRALRKKEGIFKQEEQIRENIKTLGSHRTDAELWKRLLKKLKACEDEIDSLDNEVLKIDGEVPRINKELVKAMGKLFNEE